MIDMHINQINTNCQCKKNSLYSLLSSDNEVIKSSTILVFVLILSLNKFLKIFIFLYSLLIVEL